MLGVYTEGPSDRVGPRRRCSECILRVGHSGRALEPEKGQRMSFWSSVWPLFVCHHVSRVNHLRHGRFRVTVTHVLMPCSRQTTMARALVAKSSHTVPFRPLTVAISLPFSMVVTMWSAFPGAETKTK